jgi:hypothetical protein
MTPARVLLAFILTTFFVLLPPRPVRPDDSDPGATLPALAPPDPSRAALEIPPEIWDAVRRLAGCADRRIGYEAGEMGRYGRSTFLLPTVLQLFADARTIPRFSGRVTDELLGDAGKTAAFGYGWSEGGLGEAARRCYRLLGVSTGRRVMPDTIDAAAVPFAVSPGERRRWLDLPDEIRELVTRLYVAAERARPWLHSAYDADLVLRLTGAEDLSSVAQADLHAIAMAHRNDERFGQLATLTPGTFALFETVDLAYLGYATVLWLRHVEFALHSYHAAGGSELLRGRALEGLRMPTALGDIVIGGTGNDRHEDSAFLVVELGGDDRYGPGLGAPATLASPAALILDLGGDDRYVDPLAADTTSAAALPSFGAGIFGVGALFDLEGNDEYAVKESGLGCGCFGSGLLVDFAGDDDYVGGGRWTQGTAHAGIGLLLDLSGHDRYSCAQQSQGLGGTMGTGLLLDLSGDDEYVARDDGNVSELYLGQSVAMSQGCGYGRRADLGDGHSLAGGFGLLIDGAGNDDYHAQVWAQGCGYWWGVGILEDRGGDDRYRNGKYSSGAAAHFAVGLHADLAGNDRYNVGNDTAKNQFQGHARDGSIGIFLDGHGSDVYEFRSHCAGSGDLGSIGLFWDRLGDDRYVYDQGALEEGGWSDTPPLGSITRYEPFRSFRDDLPVHGIFLDTNGSDTYETGGIGGNGTTWTMRRNLNAWGLGVDGDVYEPGR